MFCDSKSKSTVSAVDAARQELVHRERRNRDDQSRRRRQERDADAAGQLVGLAHSLRGGDVVEALNHADDGAQQSDQGSDRRDGVEHAEVGPQLADLPLAAVDDGLLDFDARLTPFADAVSENLGDGAAVFVAQPQRLFLIEIALLEVLQEAFDERPGNHAAAAQHDQPLDREPDRDHRTDAEGDDERHAEGFDDFERPRGDAAMGLGRFRSWARRRVARRRLTEGG